MDNEIERIEYKGYTITLVQDPDPDDPRSGDNLGTMVCFHPNYNLGDSPREFTSLSSLREFCAGTSMVMLPLYLYDHSGLTMNTTGFECMWDTSRVGCIYVSYTRLRKEFSCSDVSQAYRQKAAEILTTEVQVYDQYLLSDICGSIVDTNEGHHVDSCWGFYDQAQAINEAKEAVNWELKTIKESNAIFAI